MRSGAMSWIMLRRWFWSRQTETLRTIKKPSLHLPFNPPCTKPSLLRALTKATQRHKSIKTYAIEPSDATTFINRYTRWQSLQIVAASAFLHQSRSGPQSLLNFLDAFSQFKISVWTLYRGNLQPYIPNGYSCTFGTEAECHSFKSYSRSDFGLVNVMNHMCPLVLHCH